MADWLVHDVELVIDLQPGTAARMSVLATRARNCAARAHPLYKGMSEHKETVFEFGIASTVGGADTSIFRVHEHI